VIAMVPAAIAPLVWRARWIQRVTERPNVGSTPAIPRKIGSSGTRAFAGREAGDSFSLPSHSSLMVA